MTPVDLCVPSLVSIRCQANYVPIVRSAFYGVAQIASACSYTIGDCIADAMKIVTCATDTVQCTMHASKTKLSQCNDQSNSYVHIEYDCVPISMDDSTKDYNVCQNGTEITTDSGIIRSPGYPTQFQTTTAECFRAIHVPKDKTIRLWLTDLNIGSTVGTCAKDHVYVVDSVQTYRHCSRIRYAYPYLCSSTIIIQYYVTSQSILYKGMRMYFEIVDRPTNDSCPNPDGTVTPIPSTTPTITTINPIQTTPVPPYVLLGIASPVQSFQLCRGESFMIACPKNYGVVIATNIFGVTQSNQCEQHDAVKHCFITTPQTFSCRQSCMYFYPGNQLISTCGNKVAAYQYVEYQCIPTNTELVSPNIACPSDGSKIPIQINRRGRFQTYGYPNFKKMDCKYRIQTNENYIMNFYALDISLNDFSTECQANKITFVEDGESEGSDFCEQRSYSLIYSSCSNELDLRYIANDDSKFFSSGAELYIESQIRPTDWACGKPVSTTTQTTIPTSPLTTQTAVVLNETNMFAREEIEQDICFNSSFSHSCPFGYTFMMVGAFYGVKKQSSNKCGFVQGDCVEESLSTITQCRYDAPGCYILFSSRRRLALCSDQYADYLHITSQCVPSKPVGTASTITTYDICDTNDRIGNIHGIVTSPSFPTYKPATNECRRTLVGITDRMIKIWINEMAVSSGGQRRSDEHSNEPDLVLHKNDDTNNLDDLERMYPSLRETCVKDYLIINAPHVAYVYCGTRKSVISPFCTQTVDIQYKATSPPSFSYKGFKFYFEWVPRPLGVNCDGGILSSTTPINEPIPIWAENLQPSPILSAHICLGAAITLRCPRGSDYVVAIVESNYAATGTGFCEIPSPTHCHQEASLGLTCTQSCFIEYIVPKPLVQCGLLDADYINIDYECIPTRLPNNENPIDICGSTTTNTIALNSVMMISPQYPTLSPTIRSCSKTIEAPINKLWMIYVVDLDLEAGLMDINECNTVSLTINDGKDKRVVCGSRLPQLVSVSCSNIVEFSFVTSRQTLGYRGFKIFAYTIDVPANWVCTPDGFITTTTTTTARPPTTTSLSPPSFQIAAYGGTTTGARQYCKFPFIYQGNQQSSCLTVDPPGSTSGQGAQEPWCSLTSNFDTDHQWGFCDLGVTDSTLYDICRSQQQSLRCPPGYVIDIITADYAAKPDGNIGTGACLYDVNDCFQNDASTIQNTCAGKPSCIAYHFSKTLATCQNRRSAYLHIDYKCIPNVVSGITTYDMCNNNLLPQSNTRRGFIISPNFPNTQNSIDCTFNLQILKPNQDIHLYIIDMDLNSPNLLGQDCTKDRLIVSADNNNIEMCGRTYTNFILSTCHSSVSLRLIRTSDARGRGVKFYFEFRDRSPEITCIPLTTTTSRSSPVTQTGTTSASVPNYFPDPSPSLFKILCYPDFSSLLVPNFECPSNYVIVIHRAFYGKGNRCDYNVGDCTTEADNVYRMCSGKQKCSVSYFSQVTLPEFNNIVANYLFVEYQCLPTPTIVPNTVDLCTGKIDDIADGSGVLKSSLYPSYAQTQCANVTLSTLAGSDLIIFMYLLDLDIGLPDPSTGNCTNDYLSLSYQCNDQLNSLRLCGTRSTELLFSTCLPTDKIYASYNLLIQDPQAQRGFALLYQVASKFTLPTTTTTTAATSLTTIPGLGPMSTTIQIATQCALQLFSFRCDQPGYVLVVHKVQLGVSATGSCSYSSNDCFEERTHLYNACGGKTSCFISAPSLPMKFCNGAKSNYVYAEYQCIPTRPKLIRDICSSTGSSEKVEGAAIISSLNYTSESRNCTIQLQTNELLGSQIHKAFKIYILTLNLPIRPTLREQGAQCGLNDPSIEISGTQLGAIRLCGNSHTRYLLETCSNSIDIRYNNMIINTATSKYKGFEIYLESVQHDKCGATPPPPIVTSPLIITNQVACGLTSGRETVNFACELGYGLVFLQSYHFVTRRPNQCDVTQYTCFYPGEQPQAQCSGQQSCLYTHPIPLFSPSNACQNSQADSTQFYYQCLPMRPSTEYPTVKLCANPETSNEMGFIETPNYPNTYQGGRQQCSITIRIPNNNIGRGYSIYLYIIELSLRDTSTINPSSTSECFDSIKYTDGDTTNSLCGKIDQPILQYYTNKPTLTLTLNISEPLPSSELNNWQGARLFYIIGDQSLPSSPMSLITTKTTVTTTGVTRTTTTRTITTRTTSIRTTTTKITTLSATLPGPGSMSMHTILVSECVLQLFSFRCDLPGYVLVVHKVQLAASKTGVCSFSPNDCFEDRTHLYNACGGKTSCFISAPSQPMKSCNGTKSNYAYAEYQCIPTRPKLIRDICSSTGSSEKVEGAAIISSLNYTSESRNCTIQLQTNELLGSQIHKAFKIYILTLNLPIRPTLREQGAQCGLYDPSIEIDGTESGVIRLCGNSHTRYLLETCSNSIDIRYNNMIINTATSKYKGFEIYLESVQHDKCRPTPPPAALTPLFNITSQVACGLTSGRETVNFACELGYGLVFLQSYHFVTKRPNQCDVTQYTCFYPGEQPQAQCSGQQSCLYTHPIPLFSPSNACQNSQADSTQFYYQCLPMRPSTEYPTVKLCANPETSNEMGFIETPNYPNTYQDGRQQCSITIRIPNNNIGRGYSIYLYIIELSLRDTSTINPSSTSECFDSIKYTDGETTNSLCGKIDQPILQYYTNKPTLTLTLNISEPLPSNELNNWQGARLFYIIGDQSLPSSPIPVVTTKTTTMTTEIISTITRTAVTPIDQTNAPTNKKPNRGGLIAGIIIAILAVIAGITGFLLYRRQLSLRAANGPTVKYDADMTTVDVSDMNGTTEKRTSISKNSLKGPAIKPFISPFYRKSQSTEKQETENATDA